MKSIPHWVGDVQGAKMSISELGLSNSYKGCKTGGGNGGKRGAIRGWSKSSVRRLRETLFNKWIPDSTVFGLTLTVPWKDFPEDVGKEFRACLNRFKVSFCRRYPNSAFVYRIELQKRKAPHIHAVLHLAKKDGAFDAGEMSLLWFRATPLFGGSASSFIRYGVDSKPLDGGGDNLMRYLCDHASKKKQAQMGWQGRQWGVIGSKNLSQRWSEEMPPLPTPRAEGFFWRLIGKLCSYSFKKDCPFGRCRREGKRRWGVLFVPGGARTVRQCYDLALAH